MPLLNNLFIFFLNLFISLTKLNSIHPLKEHKSKFKGKLNRKTIFSLNMFYGLPFPPEHWNKAWKQISKVVWMTSGQWSWLHNGDTLPGYAKGLNANTYRCWFINKICLFINHLVVACCCCNALCSIIFNSSLSLRKCDIKIYNNGANWMLIFCRSTFKEQSFSSS